MTATYLPNKPEQSERFLKRIVDTVNRIIDGKINSVGTVTLTASATSTSVPDARCGGDSKVFLCPTTQNAAASVTTTYISATAKEGFTITHTSSADTDRTFNYVIFG